MTLRFYIIIYNCSNFNLSSLGSSFNDKLINDADNDPLGQDLFEKEQDDLLKDLIDLPRKACDRQVGYSSSYLNCPCIVQCILGMSIYINAFIIV